MITSQVGSVRVKKNFSCIFVFFVVQKFKDTKGTKDNNKSSRFCKSKKEFFVYFRVFRG